MTWKDKRKYTGGFKDDHRHGWGVMEWPDGKTYEAKHSEAIMIIHTDDCDMIGSDDSILQAILDACHEEWEVKEVDAGFMLGVKRTLIDNADEFSIEMTMTAYVDGMFTAFDEFDKPLMINVNH